MKNHENVSKKHEKSSALRDRGLRTGFPAEHVDPPAVRDQHARESRPRSQRGVHTLQAVVRGVQHLETHGERVSESE